MAMDARTKRSPAKKTKRKTAGAPPRTLSEVTRRVSEPTVALLWGRSAGRCEFSGCNQPLWKSPVTQEPVNIAQKAHIYAFSAKGPRGHKGVPRKKRNDFENLMLVCHACHRTIDRDSDGGRYPADLLRQWKDDHERRIELVTGVDPSKKSHVLLYGANIGTHSSPLRFLEAAPALFPRRHPVEDKAIELGTINSSFEDLDSKFWDFEAIQLATRFKQRVTPRLESGDIEHLSVFAIAPQPLLILLGSLMIDITSADVYQRHREPQTWRWPSRAPKLTFKVQEPSSFSGPPALVLALSAPVADDRIKEVLGPDACIWRITVAKPNTDLIKSPKHLSDFRATVRPLLDQIKYQHGQTTVVHVFPVMGVAAAVELGRVRMPKALMPWKIYDQINARGFIPALSLPYGA